MMRGGDILGAKVDYAIDDRAYPFKSLPLKNVTVARRVLTRLTPVNPGNVDKSVGEIVFELRNGSENGVDLSESYFLMQVRLQPQDTRVDGAAGTNAANVTWPTGLAPTIAAIDSMFGDIRIEINGTTVSDSYSGSNTYPYAAYSKAMLYGDTDVRRPRGWQSDWDMIILPDPQSEEGNADLAATALPTTTAVGAAAAPGNVNAVPAAIQNAILGTTTASRFASARRKKPFIDAGAGWVTVAFKPKDGVFSTPFYMPPGVTIKVTFVRSRPGFEVIANGTADPTTAANSGSTPSIRINNNSFEWWYPALYYAPDARDALTALLRTDSLPYTKDYIRTYRSPVIAHGATGSQLLQSVFTGITPDVITIQVVGADAIDRDNLALDPFNSGFNASWYLTNETDSGVANVQVEAGASRFPNWGGPLRTHAQAYALYVENCRKADLFHGGEPPLSYAMWKKRPIYVFNLHENNDPYYAGHTDDAAMSSLNLRFNFAGTLAPGDTTGDVVVIVTAFTHASFTLTSGGTIVKEGFA